MSKPGEILEIPATITARGQTTVPVAVRRMLGLGTGSHVVFRGMADGTVVLAKAETRTGGDPALGPFMALLERDLSERPDAIRPMPPAALERAAALVEGVEIDLDAPLTDDEM